MDANDTCFLAGLLLWFYAMVYGDPLLGVVGALIMLASILV